MINLSEIRKHGDRPRVHGNGFIQLDLTELSRLHIWGDPRIPRQKVATPIHDHVFSFESQIIVGRITNTVYELHYDRQGEYRVYTPQIREGEDTILMPTDTYGNVSVAHVDKIEHGAFHNCYDMPKGWFHESVASDGPAATIITKSGPTQAQGAGVKPRVLVPVGQQPDNEFNRYDADEDLLWRVIEETLKRET